MSIIVTCSGCGVKLQLKQQPSTGKFKCPKCGAISSCGPPAAEDKLVGRTIGGHKIQQVLARGKTSTLYRGTQISMRRPVAVKVLSVENPSPQQAEAFLETARAAAQLTHPNIVSIFDMGTENGTCYFSMEYVEGSSVEKALKENGTMPAQEAVKITIEAAKALAYAVQSGVKNYTLAPENAMVSEKGGVKLLSSFLQPSPAASPNTVVNAGRFLYHLLTGKALESEADVDAISQVNPGVTDSLQHVLKKMLAAGEADGYSGLDETIEALERAVGRGTARRPVRRPAARPARAAAHRPARASSRSSRRSARAEDDEADEDVPERGRRSSGSQLSTILMVVSGVCVVALIVSAIVLFAQSGKGEQRQKENALYNEIKNLIEQQRYDEAVQKCETFKRNYPDSEYYSEVERAQSDMEKQLEALRNAASGQGGG